MKHKHNHNPGSFVFKSHVCAEIQEEEAEEAQEARQEG